MTLDRTIKSLLKKEKCPNSCPFKRRPIAPAYVDPAEHIEGIIISRDPTMAWLPIYNFARLKSDEIRRLLLYATAIPGQIVSRITEFYSWDPAGNKCAKLIRSIFQLTYWTHFHKCHTDERSAEYRYNNANGVRCADTWLKNEIESVGAVKYVVALSKDVWNWMGSTVIPEQTDIIKLYHTSPRNRHIWYGEKDARARVARLEGQGKADKAATYIEQRRKLGKELKRLLDHI